MEDKKITAEKTSEEKVKCTIVETSEIKYTVEHIKATNDESNRTGFIAHTRALPLDDANDTLVINKLLNTDKPGKVFDNIFEKYEGKSKHIIDRLFTKWINRELTMTTNIMSIDSAEEDLDDLLALADTLYAENATKIVEKLQSMNALDVNKTDFTNTDVVMFLEPYIITYVDEVIVIPDEMYEGPMDISKSKVGKLLRDKEFKVDPNKLNLVIDYNNNSFIVDKNVYNRLTMKIFSNADIVVNQIIGS